MLSSVLELRNIDRSIIHEVGGKAVNLGELLNIEGVNVPEGFCITTRIFKDVIYKNSLIRNLIDKLSSLTLESRDQIGELCGKIRDGIESAGISKDLRQEIVRHLSKLESASELGKNSAYAIRSSATAEDLPFVSFAGQQDSYLNIIGEESILRHIGKCWASLFTERATIYRMQNGYDHRYLYLAVIVQQMVFPNTSGIMFTADPINGNRKIVSVDAGFGLGEGLVSGLTNADNYKVSNGRIIGKNITDKRIAIYGLKQGGTGKKDIERKQRRKQVLADKQILELEVIGRKIEGHFGEPQDIEWCCADGLCYVLQTRPITTLFPVPEPNNGGNRVYVSVGHQQMMTDAIKPLGLSIWQMTAARPMSVAAGRFFVDVTPELASPEGRNLLFNVLGKSDPLIKDALEEIFSRETFIKSMVDAQPKKSAVKANWGPSPADFSALNDYDATVVDELIERAQRSISTLQQNIKAKSGTDVFNCIIQDLREERPKLNDSRSFGVIMTGMNASSWLNEKMLEWLGEKNVADIISQSVPNNVTSEMGLALMDVADAIRPYPEVVAYFERVRNDDFLDKMEQYRGGKQSKEVIHNFLSKYGMRCAGEIDITRPRWIENLSTLLPLILANVRQFQAGEAKRKFETGIRRALHKEKELLERLATLPDGKEKVKQTKLMIDLVRNLIGYREYPKYTIVSRYYIYKQALLKEAERLIQAGVINEKEDIYYLHFDELNEMVRLLDNGSAVKDFYKELISSRKEQHSHYEKLCPPRVITSDGEVITGRYKRENVPVGAIIGLPVSSGVVEGRARVILNMEDASLSENDILVTTFTDPSWTTLFVSIKGLVTEVGGLMTHGAVIAREYGLPAVVGVENATKLIKDGQKIRINGAEGFVELL
jgi:pyruvate,water dikinase